MPDSNQDFRDNVVASLSRLETQMHNLVGNGQPGRLGHFEAKVRRHDRLIWIAIGGGGILGWIARTAMGAVFR